MATTQIPLNAYHQPSDEEVDANADYWAGYTVAQPLVQRVAPDPGTYCQYGSDNAYSHYCQDYTSMKIADVSEGYPIDLAVGINAALWDGMSWLWVNDPKSPNKVPCEGR